MKSSLPLFLLFAFIIHINSHFSLKNQNECNKNAHTLNGNIKSNSIKFAHINKGNSNFVNKIDDIHHMIDKHKPLIMSISEANYDNLNKITINDYNIETNDFKVNYHTSRQILLIHKMIDYTRRLDLERPFLAMIICDIKINKTSKITVIAHYRQWSIPKELLNITIDSQINRYNTTIEIFENILKTNKNDIIIVGDDNIDTLNSNNFHNTFKNHELKDIRDNFLINNNLVSHHNKPTFFRKGKQSCLDHLYTNCPSKVKNVTIEKDIISDHKLVTFTYNNKKLSLNALYKVTRDYSLLKKDTLLHYFNINKKINDIFSSDDPNLIADIIISQLDTIINSIAPAKRIQCVKKHTKWYTPELEKLAELKKQSS